MDLGTARATLTASAEALTEAGTRLRHHDEPRFGATGPGRLGDLGRELSRHWQCALDARAHEASAHAERLRDLASVLAQAGGRYGAVDTERQKAQNQNAQNQEAQNQEAQNQEAQNQNAQTQNAQTQNVQEA